MKSLITTAALGVVAAAFALGTPALAQSHHGGHHDNGRGSHSDRSWDHGRDRDHRDWGRNDRWGNDRYRHNDRSYYSGWRDHSSWRRGGYVSRYDYDRGYVVDYRYHRGLYRPPYGYEWRRVDNNYVLVALTTGLIASIILDGGY